MKRFVKKFLGILCLSLVFNSCQRDDDSIIGVEQRTADEYNANVIVDWYALIKTLTTETTGYTPPVAARAFGYTGIALYEGILPGMPNKTSFSGKLTEFQIDIVADKNKIYHWPTVANAVLAGMTKHFYSNTSQERLDAIVSLEASYKDQFLAENGQIVYENSADLAKKVIDIILDWSKTDGGEDGQFNNFPSEYVPPSGPQFWVPTPPSYSPALQPYWGSNRPFLVANIEDTRPVAPPEYSTDENSVFYQRAFEVYTAVKNITPEEKIIAEFWSDDPVTTATPPGHSISILNQLIKKENLGLDLAAEAFAKLGIGISDSFISCWKTKYETSYPRPVTYINEYIDPEWTPILVTPPFPEYTSGHSVQSGALAEIMTDLFGDNFAFTDYTHDYRTDINGTARPYSNFYELAREAAISRMYGGIHFKEAIELGLEQGYQIGRNVNALNMDK